MNTHAFPKTPNLPRSLPKTPASAGRCVSMGAFAMAPILTAVTVVMAVVGGCASQPELPDESELPQTAGDFKPPQIISGNPNRDALVAAEADQQLSEADWRILERLGPRPIWEQIVGSRKDWEKRHGDAGAPGAAPPSSPAAQPAAAGPPSPYRTVSQAPDVSQLPVTITPTENGRLRIIWVLRSYGGRGVNSSRDDNTNRRDVTTKAPNLDPLVGVVKQELGENGNCTALPEENTLVINCDPPSKSRVLSLLSQLDVAPQQVEITAKIFEVSQDFDFQQGTEILLNRIQDDGSQALMSTFSAKRFADSYASTAGGPVQGSVLQVMQVFEDAGISVDASFQLLAESGLIKVVSQPRMTVAVGQTGYMLAGQELPIQSAQLSNGVLKTSTQYKPVGVQLYITPQASSSDRVKLHMISIVSAISGFEPLPSMDGANFSQSLINPVINSREAETAVTVRHGDTLVVSGLRMVRSATRENKIPWLGDLPGLEWMFKNHRSQQRMTDLYFFVTPRLLPAAADDL